MLGRLMSTMMVLSLLLGLHGCRDEAAKSTLQGYVEADYTYVASQLAGRLEELAVARGGQVKAGAVLFRLEDTLEKDTLREAEQRLSQARDKLADLQKGARPSEIAALEASLRKAQSSLSLSNLSFERRQKLYRQKTIPKEDLDRARSALQGDRATVAELKAQLQTARLGAREDLIKSAAAEARALAAKAAQARWNLDQKAQRAPGAGLVFDTFYTKGELVPAGNPVVALLLPGNLKVRFFVPEERLSRVRIGRRVALACDGCPAGLTATVSYVSPQAEYTPPVIYSNQTRAKLVFMVEARPGPGQALAFMPGQPMDVDPAPKGAAQ